MHDHVTWHKIHTTQQSHTHTKSAQVVIQVFPDEFHLQVSKTKGVVFDLHTLLVENGPEEGKWGHVCVSIYGINQLKLSIDLPLDQCLHLMVYCHIPDAGDVLVVVRSASGGRECQGRPLQPQSIYTHIHTHTRARIHTHTRTHTHTRIHTHIHTHTLTHSITHTHPHTHSLTQIHTNLQ